jgi:hypothetical protein
MQTLPYVGFPAVANALSAAIDVLIERELESDTSYGGHQGVL